MVLVLGILALGIGDMSVRSVPGLTALGFSADSLLVSNICIMVRNVLCLSNVASLSKNCNVIKLVD